MLSAGSAAATAVQDVFSTPCPPIRKKVSSKPNHISVVTPLDNIPSNTVCTRVSDDKDANSNEHNYYIDISSDNGMVNESRNTIDNDGNEGLGGDLVGDMWNKLPDLVIICPIVYGPDTSSYIIDTVGNMSRSIYND